jgi:hypothetical protein
MIAVAGTTIRRRIMIVDASAARLGRRRCRWIRACTGKKTTAITNAERSGLKKG